jgi:TonB family protein
LFLPSYFCGWATDSRIAISGLSGFSPTGFPAFPLFRFSAFPPMSPREQFDYAEKRTFWGRFGFGIGLCAAGAVVVVVFSQALSGHKGPNLHKAPELVMIRPLAAPPPPPPPPPQMVQRQQVTEQTMVNDQDITPDDQPKEAPASLGTSIQGNGPPDAFGLGRHDTGIFSGQGVGGGQGVGNRFGSYFSGVKEALSDALRQNPLTRDASFNIKVRIWADLTGRITRAKLVESTGDAAIDQAIKTVVLIGRQLPDTPSGMNMPIELHLTARRPN